jgi:DNA-binding NtrC family response regulator
MRNAPGVLAVLIIDDEPELLEVARYLLAREDGVIIFTATSFSEANAVLREHLIHFIICDYHIRSDTPESWMMNLRLSGNEALFLIYTGSYDVDEQHYPPVDGCLKTVLKTDIKGLQESLRMAKFYWAS